MLRHDKSLPRRLHNPLRYGEEAGRLLSMFLLWGEESPDSMGKGAG